MHFDYLLLEIPSAVVPTTPVCWVNSSLSLSTELCFLASLSLSTSLKISHHEAFAPGPLCLSLSLPPDWAHPCSWWSAWPPVDNSQVCISASWHFSWATDSRPRHLHLESPTHLKMASKIVHFVCWFLFYPNLFIAPIASSHKNCLLPLGKELRSLITLLSLAFSPEQLGELGK